MKAAGPDAAKLLRWYPRAWRERYGEEFLAMVEDWLDGGRPGWRLRLSVAWAGLCERGHQARLASQKGLLRAFTGRWSTFVLAGYFFVIFPNDFKASPPPARAWQATTVLDVLTAIAACTVVALLAGGLVAVPAFARYLRAGGGGRAGWHTPRTVRISGLDCRAVGGIPQLALLLIIFAGPLFVLPFAVETFLRLHDEPLWPRYSYGHGTMEPL